LNQGSLNEDSADKVILKRVVKIEANLEGFLNYFTAQNIRFKLRHPVFLALKFH